MKIAILGAGAIGGYYGARLVEAGAEVTFVVRPARRARLEQDGLVVHSELGQHSGRARSVANIVDAGAVDLVLLACKAFDLDAAIGAIGPAMTDRTVVLPLLNGLDAYDRLDARFGKARVLGGVAYIATSLAADGSIEHAGRNDVLIVGDRDQAHVGMARRLIGLFNGGPGERLASDDIMQALWDKWVLICAGASLCCLMRGTVADILGVPFGGTLMRQVVADCGAVSARSGHPVSAEAMQRMQALLLNPQSHWAASMMRDIWQDARRLEGDAIVGDMARRARSLGLETPLLEAAACHLAVYEKRALRPGAAASR